MLTASSTMAPRRTLACRIPSVFVGVVLFESRGLQRLAFRCLGLGVQDLGFFVGLDVTLIKLP